jgi:hypothetical protein
MPLVVGETRLRARLCRALLSACESFIGHTAPLQPNVRFLMAAFAGPRKKGAGVIRLVTR